MIVLMMRVEFDIRGVRSIKEKRQTRLRVIERLHHHYKVSVKEIEKQDSLDFLVIGIAEVLLRESEASEKKEKYLEKIEEWSDYPVREVVWDCIVE